MRHCITFLLLLPSISIFAQMEHKDSLNLVVDEYYRLNLKIFQSTSELSDIDSLFLYFTDDFTYVHPKYGGVYTRQDLYEGYRNNQKKGGYDGSVQDIKVIRRIVGLNAVAIERQYVSMSEGNLSLGEPQMTLFEFRDGKIFRIREFW